ncbi:MAG: ABC transporter permease [Pseudomonadota bacterium]
MLRFSFKRLFTIFLARNREFYRDKPALIWSLLFPLILIFGFSVIFSDSGQNQLKIGLINTPEIPDSLKKAQYVSFIFYEDALAAQEKVNQHQIDALINWNEKLYITNQESPKGYLSQQLIANHAPFLEHKYVSTKVIRYVDWVLPGVLGMNIMFSCLFGVGFVIVRYRKNGVLKRLKATPIQALEFVTAQIFSRFFIVTLVTTFIFIATKLLLGFTVVGNYFYLFITFILGASAMIALGFLVASTSKSEELTSGMLNVASWPMMMLSNVWFSLENAPQMIKGLANLLPLTHLVTASRSIMIEGAGFEQIAHHWIALLLMSLLFFSASAKFFDWGSAR